MKRSWVLAAALAAALLLVGGMLAVHAFGTVPEADPGSPLAIEIPGCVCHSDDPAVVEEHARYRMNQCFGCHAEGVPELAQ